MTPQGKIPRSATKNNLDLLIQLLKNKTLLACITNYKIIDPNNEEMMIVKLQEGICLCTSFYLFKEFEEYKHGQDSVYEGTSGRGWGDDGFGRIFWGSNAFNPVTGKNDFNLLY